MADEKFVFTDGTTAELDPKRAAAVRVLAAAMEAIAKGVTSGFALVEISQRGNTRDTVLTLDGAHLAKLAEGVAAQQEAIANLATLWEGNAPAASRTFTRQ